MSQSPLQVHPLIGICRAHSHWFETDKVHEPCPEPGCEAACDYYQLIPDAKLKAMTEPEPEGEDDDPWWRDDRPIVGNCSKCGEAREDFYTCRKGGETIAKEPS